MKVPSDLEQVSAACRPRYPEKGLTLIEMVGVLAIFALVGMVFTSLTLAYAERMARETETRTLRQLAEALRLSVTRDLIIPDQTTFADQVARFSGQLPATIRTNARGNPRFLLIDPATTNSGWNVPFAQTNNPLSGAGAGELRNLRMMLVSSISIPFTNGLPPFPGGKPTSVVFSNLWATPRGQLPTGVTWAGDPHDLCIQRIQFLDMFHPVIFNHAERTGSYTNGQVRLSGMSGFSAPMGAPLPQTRWYLEGTRLVLSNAADRATLSEIVQEPVSYTYEKGYWLRSMNDLTAASGRLSRISGADFERAVQEFLSSATNSGGRNPGDAATARNAVNAISNYVLWGSLGPTSANIQKMDQSQAAMRAAFLDYTDLPSGQFNKP